ncbi:hypothetical protein JXQ70_02790 [bacterium]|nr:hypothetical protein [bacterium]
MTFSRYHNSHYQVMLHILLLVALFCLSFGIRILRYNDALFNGSLLPLGVDSYYHLRRIHLAVQHWPHLIEFDSYLDYPEGAPVVHPPGYDFLVATIGYCAGGFHYDRTVVDLVAALVSPVSSAATTMIVFLIGFALFNRSVGYWAALLHAILYAGIWTGKFGAPDHHPLESLFVPILYFLFMKSDLDNYQKFHMPRSKILLMILCLWTAQLIWRGAIMYLSFFFGITVILLLHAYYRESAPIPRQIILQRLKLMAGLLVSLAIFLLPVVFHTYYGQRYAFVYYALSLFQPALYLAMGLSVFLIVMVLTHVPFSQDKAVKRIVGAILLICTLIAILMISHSSILSPLSDGFFYLFKADPWMQQIDETQPLFSLKAEDPMHRVLVFFGYWIFLYPVLIIVLALQKKTIACKIFIAWSLFNLILTLIQIRYSHQLVLTLSILSGFFIWQVANIQLPRLSIHKYIRVSLALLFFFILSKPSLDNMSGYIKTRFQPERVIPLNLLDTLVWIRDHTPETSFFSDPSQSPEYGVMSIWDYGNWVNSIAQRPVIASNFGFLHKGLLTSCLFFTSSSWSEIQTILDDHHIRYIILGNFRDRLDSYREILASKASHLLSSIPDHEEPLTEKLYWSDGRLLGPVWGPCQYADQLRLVYESPPDPTREKNNKRNNFLVFEYVKGARLPIRGEPGTSYKISVTILTNQNRLFVYQQYGRLDMNGSKILFLPYSTSDNDTAVTSTGPYRLEIDADKQISIEVESSSIYEGSTLPGIDFMTGTLYRDKGEDNQSL